MKMFMVLAVLALAAAPSSSAQQIDWEWPQQGTYGGAAAVYPCAEFLLQPQCSPVAAPYYARRGQTMWQPSAVCQPLRHQCCLQLGLMDAMSRCQAMCGVAQSVVPQLQLQGAARGPHGGGAGRAGPARHVRPLPAAQLEILEIEFFLEF